MKFRVRKPGSKIRLKRYKKRKAWRDLTERNSTWHSWFAWFPVRVPTKGRMSGMTLVWLERVERRGKWGTTEESLWDWQWLWTYRFKGVENEKN